MKTIILALCLAAFASACNYSHVGVPNATFNRLAPPVGTGANEIQGGPLVLSIGRHLDEVLRGPDPDEDQILVLTIPNVRLGQKLEIPSESVIPDFTATRFGPSSKGDMFVGYVIVKKVTPQRVDAAVHVDVTAHTPSGSYTETAKFHGEYTFSYRSPDNDPTP